MHFNKYDLLFLSKPELMTVIPPSPPKKKAEERKKGKAIIILNIYIFLIYFPCKFEGLLRVLVNLYASFGREKISFCLLFGMRKKLQKFR